MPEIKEWDKRTIKCKQKPTTTHDFNYEINKIKWQ